MPHVPSVKFRNYLSYGNSWTEFNFEDGVTRLTGKNGHGKSTPMEALYYGFTGKPYRDVNLSQLPNSINKKELEVHVPFYVNNTFYRIERGIKPNIFKIYKKEGEWPSDSDEDLVPLNSASRTYQQVLEEDILQFPAAKILDQVAIKSMTKNMSFLSLSKGDKREIVENMLDIKVFTEMNKLAKTKADALEKELVDLKKTLEHSQMLMNQEESNLKRLEMIRAQQREDIRTKQDRIDYEISDIDCDTQECVENNIKLEEKILARQAEIDKKTLGIQKIQKHKEKKTSLRNAIISINEGIVEFEAKIKEVQQQIRAVEDKIRDWKAAISLSENKTKFLTKTCGGCAKIDQISHNDNVVGLRKSVADAEAEIKQFEDTIELNKASIDLLRSDITGYNTQISKCDEYINFERPFMTDIEQNKRFIASERATIEQNEKRIERNAARIQEKLASRDEEQKQEIVIDFTKRDQYREKMVTIKTEYDQKAKLKKHIVYARKLLADDAIKAFVVNKYLPSINMIFNSYLQKFGSEITLNFDSEFNEVFTGRFKENYSYASLSEGQKKRVDLAVLFMWRKFCQTKFQQADMNFMILDEVSSGLDVDTQEILSAMLKDLSREEKKSIITISHDSKVDPEKTDNLYHVEMEAGFSKITKQKL